MKATFAIAFALLAQVLSAGASSACSCAVKTPLDQLAISDLVISGSVVSTVEHDGVSRALVAVADVWKGTPGSMLIVETTTVGSCQFLLSPGTKYLIYGLSAEVDDDLFRTHVCMRTRPADQAAEDIKQLGPPLFTFTPVELISWGTIKLLYR